MITTTASSRAALRHILTTLVLILLPLLALGGNPAEIPVLIAVQYGTDGKPMAAPPVITGLVGQLAIESGLNLVVRSYPWRRALWLAEQGEGLVYGAAATPERLSIYAFSQPLYEVSHWLVVSRQQPFVFTEWSDLKGKLLSIQQGVHFMGEFEALRGSLFRVAENSESITSRLKMLTLKRVDALVLDNYRNAAQFEERLNCAYGDIGKWTVLDKPVSTEPVLMAVGLKSPLRQHLETINAAIERLNQRGGIRKAAELQAARPACA